jgi:hypothetical protein
MSAEPNLTDQDYELLSAYIDGMLDEGEISALEARLQVEPGLRQELHALRRTVTLVRALPPLKAPRNFALTAGMLGTSPRKRTQRAPERRIIYPVFSVASAAAALMMFFLGFYLLYGPQPAAPDQDTVAMLAADEAAETTAARDVAAAATATLAAITMQAQQPGEDPESVGALSMEAAVQDDEFMPDDDASGIMALQPPEGSPMPEDLIPGAMMIPSEPEPEALFELDDPGIDAPTELRGRVQDQFAPPAAPMPTLSLLELTAVALQVPDLPELRTEDTAEMSDFADEDQADGEALAAVPEMDMPAAAAPTEIEAAPVASPLPGIALVIGGVLFALLAVLLARRSRAR